MKKSVIDAMKKRHSVRGYGKKAMNHAIEGQLQDFCRHIEPLFGAKLRIELASKEQPGGQKLGTYGIINNAKTFIIGVCDRSDYAEEALGYAMEEVILFATRLGLGTCWLGGTFNKGAFADAVDLKHSECLPVVSPVGIGATTPGLIGTALSKAVKSKSRKAFEALFFTGDWRTPLNPKTAGDFALPLEMVRLAPSAMNAQPWRLLIEGSRVHFYRILPKKLNRIDMGIAMCHFDLACQERGIFGHFEHIDEAMDKTPPNGFYTVSWVKN